MTEQQPSLDDSGEAPERWRNEVQSRLERYKRRRGRRIEGAFSMRFPFPPEETAAAQATAVLEALTDQEPVPVGSNDPLIEVRAEPPIEELETRPGNEESTSPEKEIKPTQTALAAAEGVSVAVAPHEPESESEETTIPVIELPPRPQPRRKVIAFPAPAYAAPVEMARRIADPVQPEQLRILDVPEELQAVPATPFLEGLLDAPAAPPASVRTDTVELPCAPAHGARRAGAALIDIAVTLAGVGICAAVASRFVTELPSVKFVVAGAAAVSVMLWASYQYLFVVYGGRTLGMRAARVRLKTFKNRALNFRQRRLRVFGLYLSVLSLGMGVWWYFADTDSLCWHDRISQTFPAAAGKS